MFKLNCETERLI